MQAGKDRVAWGDYAKGFCIVMVVMMHSTLVRPGGRRADELDGGAGGVR